MNRNETIDKIIEARPHLRTLGEKAKKGSLQALKSLSDNACTSGGTYLSSIEWYSVSKWGIRS